MPPVSPLASLLCATSHPKVLSAFHPPSVGNFWSSVLSEINGKMMAEILKLSPSVVSRRLAQLRNAGLIDEHSKDNRNITYTVRVYKR